MKFRTALALAAGVHVLVMLLLWRSWPEAPAPSGEVVPLELRAAEPPPAPPPVIAAPPAPVAAPAAGGGKPEKHAPRMVVALQPESGGEVPAAPAVESPGGGAGGSGGGSGPGVGPGSAPTGPVAAPAVVDHGPLRAQAMERIRQQRRYPELARRRHIEGTVIVVFRVVADGGVSGLRVKQSVDEMLDQAALDAVRSAAPLPAALSSDGELEVPFQFSLRP